MLLFTNLISLVSYSNNKLVFVDNFIIYSNTSKDLMYTCSLTTKTEQQITSGILSHRHLNCRNVEISADPCAEIILRQGLLVIHQTFVFLQSRCTNDHTVINVATEIDRNLHNTSLKI